MHHSSNANSHHTNHTNLAPEHPSMVPRLVFPVPETMSEWRAWRAHFPLIVLYVWKESCMPCLKVKPAFERLAVELAQRFPGRTLCAKDQIDDAHRREEDTPTFAHWKMCHAVPFFIVFQNGQMVDQLTGYDERQLRAMIEKAIQQLGW
ncbi:thioredoxin [bacterium]|nr:thioredoxin [bacterium]